ncbi:MAG: carnitine 3-dehydrogenase [Pseudomonadota bacterium]
MTGQRAAIIGGGVIGGGWAARFLLNGWDVVVHDPAPGAGEAVEAVLSQARRALPSLYDRVLPDAGTLSFADTLSGAVAGADWVQESVPERLEVKHAVLGQITAAARPEALIASSTSGFKPSDLTAKGARAIVAHPFNPVYLLPLVELVGDAANTQRAAETLRGIGMAPLVLRREIDAHIADRLLEAVWREALWLVRDGVASTAEIDDAIRLGFGIRWAQMGLFETYRIAGGTAGMQHFLRQFGPALHWPWSRLTDVPELTDDLVAKIAAQSDAQSGHLSIRELERLRDDNIVALLRGLRRTNSGAGAVIAAHEATLPMPTLLDGLPVTGARVVPTSWTDYNGHMNESHYLEAASAASDTFMALIGADAAYIAAGHSFFTVETTIRHLAEVQAGARLTVTTQVLAAEGRKMALLHRLWCDDDTLSATVATLLVHVDLTTRRGSAPSPDVAAALARYAAAHADFDTSGAGRFGMNSP